MRHLCDAARPERDASYRQLMGVPAHHPGKHCAYANQCQTEESRRRHPSEKPLERVLRHSLSLVRSPSIARDDFSDPAPTSGRLVLRLVSEARHRTGESPLPRRGTKKATRILARQRRRSRGGRLDSACLRARTCQDVAEANTSCTSASNPRLHEKARPTLVGRAFSYVAVVRGRSRLRVESRPRRRSLHPSLHHRPRSAAGRPAPQRSSSLSRAVSSRC